LLCRSEYDGKITYIALGRLTNLALALSLDPTLVDLISEVVVMGGAIHQPGNASPVASANLYGDVMAAAVADFTPGIKSDSKIKKEAGMDSINLIPTKDILAGLGSAKKKGQILVGFALETDNELENAKSKLQRKNLDLIVLNSLKDEGAGFTVSTNKVTIIEKNNKHFELPLLSKREVADQMVEVIKRMNIG
jgi:phosphopantothenoylcysteine decarboxylase/phosphopantothenate--cysteine ligase